MSNLGTFAVILPAAGSGSRFGGGDKLLVDLAGKTVLQRSVELFVERADVAHLVIVTAAERIAGYREHLAAQIEPSKIKNQKSKIDFVSGGEHRWQSVMNGLRFLAALADAPGFVGIHDAARPLCPREVIDEAFRVTVEKGAGLPCVAEPATLKRRGPDGTVIETVPRAGLFQAQTPQCFACRPLLEGFEMLLSQGRVADLTDDAQVFERIGRSVPITTGSPLNLKITTAADVALAMGFLESPHRST